jgi:hypothetical protein
VAEVLGAGQRERDPGEAARADVNRVVVVEVQARSPSSVARYIEQDPLEAGLMTEPWQHRWSSSPAYALGVADGLLSYNVWYQGLGTEPRQRQQRWRAFLVGENPRERAVRPGAWVVGDESDRRLEYGAARPARRRGRPQKPPPGQEGVISKSYATEEHP